MYEASGQTRLRRLGALLAAIFLGMSLSVHSVWAQERTVIPLGQAVGIKLFADGVLVVGLSELDEDAGKSPAQQCGLKEGDLILCFNGEKIQSTEHFQSLLQENGETEASLTVQRGDEKKTVAITPTCCDDGGIRLGAWIRDSMAGIGTMTYYDPDTGAFGALGHGITDVDTEKLMSLGSGSIMETTVKAVKKGQRGDPGELKGDFSVQKDVGKVTVNCEGGIFGTVTEPEIFAGQPVPVATPQQVQTGDAVIRCTVCGSESKEYQVKITKIFGDEDSTRNLLLRITDPNLLEQTGGIVQGMSGSPILQNGRLVGAVTHVMVNDPTQGYGILAENMLRRAE